MNTQKGFTIIETLVYLALFGIMIGGMTVAAYLMFESSDRNQTKAMLQEEKNFLIGKIDQAMSGAKEPVTVSSSPATLTIAKYSGSTVQVCLSGTDMRYLSNGGSCSTTGVILNNSNVKIKNLTFIHTYDSTNPLNPDSIEAGFTISALTPEGTTISQTASTTVYIRK